MSQSENTRLQIEDDPPTPNDSSQDQNNAQLDNLGVEHESEIFRFALKCQQIQAQASTRNIESMKSGFQECFTRLEQQSRENRENNLQMIHLLTQNLDKRRGVRIPANVQLLNHEIIERTQLQGVIL